MTPIDKNLKHIMTFVERNIASEIPLVSYVLYIFVGEVWIAPIVFDAA